MEDISVKIEVKSRLFAYYEKYMMAMGIVGQSLFYIQGSKIFLSHSAQDVSLTGFMFALFSVSSWLIYGLIIKNKVLVLSNIVAVIGALFVVFGIVLYG